MGSSDKALKVFTIAIFASVAAYAGYRIYKKRYPFEESKTKSPPTNQFNSKLAPNALICLTLPLEGQDTSSPTSSEISNEVNVELADDLRLKGNAAYKAEDYSHAIKFYDEAIFNYPESHQDLALTYANRAACFLKLNRFEAVIDDCSKAIEIKPEFIKALDRRSKALENLDRLEESLIDVTAACIMDDFKTNSLVNRVESLLQFLSTRNAEKDFESKGFALPSNALIEEFFSTFPFEWDVEIDASQNEQLFNVINLIKSGKISEALALNEEAIESESYREISLTLQGSVQFLKGDMKSAYEMLSLAKQINPSNSNVLIKLALIELERNNYLQMHEHLEKAYEADPKNPALFYHRGEIFALSGNLQEAINDFDTAIKLYPNFILAYVHKARAFLGIERYSDAEELLREAMNRFDSKVEIWNSLGEVMVMKKDFESAENIFNSILLKYPKTPEVYLNMALLSMTRNNDSSSAEKHLRKAIEIEPSFEAAHLQLANLLLSSGNVKDSMIHFEQAVKYARTLQELISVHSLKCASVAQVKIVEKFPSLAAKMK